jgi:hypothetical protein
MRNGYRLMGIIPTKMNRIPSHRQASRHSRKKIHENKTVTAL